MKQQGVFSFFGVVGVLLLGGYGGQVAAMDLVNLAANKAGNGGFPDGVYVSRPGEKSRTIVRVQGGMANIEVSSATCAGNVSLLLSADGEGSATGSGGGCQVAVVAQNDGAVMLSELSGCLDWHGVSCGFGGAVRWKSALPAGYRAPPVSRLMPAAVRGGEGVTRIEAFPVGARVIIEGEYVGNAPVTVNLRDYGARPDSAYPPPVVVKVLPARNGGCVAAEIVSRRLPKRMFLDTRLCPVQPESGAD